MCVKHVITAMILMTAGLHVLRQFLHYLLLLNQLEIIDHQLIQGQLSVGLSVCLYVDPFISCIGIVIAFIVLLVTIAIIIVIIIVVLGKINSEKPPTYNVKTPKPEEKE